MSGCRTPSTGANYDGQGGTPCNTYSWRGGAPAFPGSTEPTGREMSRISKEGRKHRVKKEPQGEPGDAVVFGAPPRGRAPRR